MTGEEMERAIEFLLQSQANFETRLEQLLQNQAQLLQNQANFETGLEQTNRQVAETSRQVQIYAETQTEFIQVVTQHIEAQAEINASLRGTIRELATSQSRTDERINRLADTFERHIREGHHGNS